MNSIMELLAKIDNRFWQMFNRVLDIPLKCTYSKLSQTFMTKLFLKEINSWKLGIIFVKFSNLDILIDFEYASVIFDHKKFNRFSSWKCSFYIYHSLCQNHLIGKRFVTTYGFQNYLWRDKLGLKLRAVNS